MTEAPAGVAAVTVALPDAVPADTWVAVVVTVAVHVSCAPGARVPSGQLTALDPLLEMASFVKVTFPVLSTENVWSRVAPAPAKLVGFVVSEKVKAAAAGADTTAGEVAAPTATPVPETADAVADNETPPAST